MLQARAFPDFFEKPSLWSVTRYQKIHLEGANHYQSGRKVEKDVALGTGLTSGYSGQRSLITWASKSTPLRYTSRLTTTMVTVGINNQDYPLCCKKLRFKKNNQDYLFFDKQRRYPKSLKNKIYQSIKSKIGIFPVTLVRVAHYLYLWIVWRDQE